MEKKTLLKILEALGWVFGREGTKHEIWTHSAAVRFIPIPRGKKLNSKTAKSIMVCAKKYIGGC